MTTNSKPAEAQLSGTPLTRRMVTIGLAAAGIAALGGPARAEIRGTSAILVAVARLTGIQRIQLRNRGIEVGPWLGGTSYLIFLPAGQGLTADTFNFVRSITDAPVSRILSRTLQQGSVPVHARLNDGRILVVVEMFRVAYGDAVQILGRYGTVQGRDQTTRGWRVAVEEQNLARLAKAPGVMRVGLPRRR